MVDQENNSKGAPTWPIILLAIFFITTITVFGSGVGLSKRIESLEYKASGIKASPTLDSLVNNDSQYVWVCVEWFGKCNELMLDTDRGYYILRGYVEVEECDPLCSTHTLRKKRKLTTIPYSDMISGLCGNGRCETELNETYQNCLEDCSSLNKREGSGGIL